jgi:hypothetical protein
LRLSIWKLEWRIALRRRRLLLLNMGIPLLLVVPIAVGGAPAYHASAAYTVLFVLFASFGSAIPLLREGSEGLLRRIVLRGVPEPTLLGERVLASTGLDCLELLPAIGAILLVGRPDPTVWIALLPALVLSLLAANLVGVWVAAGARSIAEGALFASVVSLFLLHGSGVFRTPAPGGWGAAVEGLLPFSGLHEALFASAAGGDLPLTFGQVLLPMISTGTFALVTLLLAGTLIERITLPAH